jgi:hypothetical protein
MGRRTPKFNDKLGVRWIGAVCCNLSPRRRVRPVKDCSVPSVNETGKCRDKQ